MALVGRRGNPALDERPCLVRGLKDWKPRERACESGAVAAGDAGDEFEPERSAFQVGIPVQAFFEEPDQPA